MKTFVIDPGHGWPDPGAVNGAVEEAAITLAVAREVAAELQRRGHIALLTRHTKYALVPAMGKRAKEEDLEKRSVFANLARADFFISIHINAHGNTAAKGLETFCYRFTSQGAIMAQLIQTSLLKEFGFTDRGVKEAGFWVLRKTNMPANLVELGFISNEEDRKVMTSQDFPERVARAIGEGIDLFLKQ